MDKERRDVKPDSGLPSGVCAARQPHNHFGEGAVIYVDLFESEVIALFAYDGDARLLMIQFKDGDFYEYRDVPRAVFDGFRSAPSKGAYFQVGIRERFAARRLTPDEVMGLARRHQRSPGCPVG